MTWKHAWIIWSAMLNVVMNDMGLLRVSWDEASL